MTGSIDPPKAEWPQRARYPRDMSNRFLPIDAHRPRLADEVYRQIVTAVGDGTLRPGDRLIQERLAEAMGVSRTPVREALLRLEREGLITPAGRRGFVVRGASEGEIRDIYETREAIEGYAARLLAERGDTAALDRVADLVAHHASLADTSVYEGYLANRAVHRAIVEATGNAQLVDLFEAVWDRAVALLLYADVHPTTESDFETTHAELLEALRSRDPERACAAMIDHVRSGLAEQLAAHARHPQMVGEAG